MNENKKNTGSASPMKSAAVALSLLAILAGCSTAPKSRVLLFGGTDYIWTRPGEQVSGRTTDVDGIWFSIPAIERLQNAQILPGGPR